MPATKRIKNLASVGVATAETGLSLSDLRHPVRSDGKRFVGKNSLNEMELVRAKELAMKEASMSDEAKRKERRAANRLSAFQSRERRKIIIQELQERVKELSRENEEQRLDLVKAQAELRSVTKERDMFREELEKAPSRSSKHSFLEDTCNSSGKQLSSSPFADCWGARQQTFAQPVAPIVGSEDVARNLLGGLLGVQRQQAFNMQRQPQAAVDMAALLGNAPSSTLQEQLRLLEESLRRQR